MCVWLLVINRRKRAPRLFANVCNSNFKKITPALGQTLGPKNILLHLDDTRESPDFIGIFKKNQQVRKYLEIELLVQPHNLT
jgi:hypothetical protein